MFRTTQKPGHDDQAPSSQVMGIEAQDSAYHAARERHATRVSQNESRATHQHYIRRAWEQLVNYAQLLLVCYALYWLFHNQAMVLGWWDGLLDLLKSFI